jgi:LPS export ABC transporter protein LptC
VLAACSDTGVRPPTVREAADSADQILFKMGTKITNGGVLRSFVEAETAFVYQRTQSTDFRHFTARMLDEKGNLKSTLTADRGIYLQYSNKLDARGHVVVVSTDNQKITTEHLIYDKQANRITIDTAFVFDSPTEHLTGDSLITDVDFTNVRVGSPKGRQKGKGFLLPGQ